MATRPLPAGPHDADGGPAAAGAGGRDRSPSTSATATPTRWPTTPSSRSLVTQAGGGPGPADGQALSVTGPRCPPWSARRGALHVRVFNPTDEASTVRHRRAGTGWLVDLRGPTRCEPFEGTLRARPWGIATAALAG